MSLFLLVVWVKMVIFNSVYRRWIELLTHSGGGRKEHSQNTVCILDCSPHFTIEFSQHIHFLGIFRKPSAEENKEHFNTWLKFMFCSLPKKALVKRPRVFSWSKNQKRRFCFKFGLLVFVSKHTTKLDVREKVQIRRQNRTIFSPSTLHRTDFFLTWNTAEMYCNVSFAGGRGGQRFILIWRKLYTLPKNTWSVRVRLDLPYWLFS